MVWRVEKRKPARRMGSLSASRSAGRVWARRQVRGSPADRACPPAGRASRPEALLAVLQLRAPAPVTRLSDPSGHLPRLGWPAPASRSVRCYDGDTARGREGPAVWLVRFLFRFRPEKGQGQLRQRLGSTSQSQPPFTEAEITEARRRRVELGSRARLQRSTCAPLRWSVD